MTPTLTTAKTITVDVKFIHDLVSTLDQVLCDLNLNLLGSATNGVEEVANALFDLLIEEAEAQ